MYTDKTLLHDIVANSTDPVAIFTGNDLKIESANAAMLNMWGQNSSAIGKKYSDIIIGYDDNNYFAKAAAVLKTGIPFHEYDKKVEILSVGVIESYYFNFVYTALFDTNGKVYAVINTNRDVTDLHFLNLKLKIAEQSLEIAIDSTEIATYQINLKTNEILTSENFNSICSIKTIIYTEALLANMNADDFSVKEKANKDAENSGVINYEANIHDDDNPLKWCKINSRIIKDKNNNPHFVIGVIHDVSEQRDFEKKLQKRVASSTIDLKRSNEDLLHFANIVSHDLREPLRKIKIFNTLLRNNKEVEYSVKLVNYLDKIDHSSERMQNIIEGILAYSTLDKNTQPVQIISLNETIENIKIDLEIIINEKDAILTTSDLPDIQGAPILIYQLFYNLLQNALKFSKAEQPPRVKITSIFKNIDGVECIEISIKDNGIGINSAFSEKIFTAFERLHSKGQYEGNGLGLALCKKIAKRHNGTITVKGEEDKGAEFLVTLPIKQMKENI